MSENADRADGKPPHLDRLSVLWRRLSDHKIVQWSVAYVVLAYAIQHAIILTSESLEWPTAVARVSMLLLALGLPLVVTFAWYHGARASRNFSQAELSILTALLAIGSLFFYVMVRPSEEPAASRATSVEAGVAAARSASLDPHSALSVAVLPFENLSGDASQEFFSEGMTQEIVAALAKIPDLRVVARGSASQFKGERKDLRAVGQALGATHLIEGSVRKAGERVRITAQLVKAEDGVNVWVNSYDREMTDVFAIQEDIATAIARALRMPLGLKPGEQLVSNRAVDPASYEQFLRGKAELLHGRGAFAQQIAILEPVVQRNPNYAPAWAALAQGYSFAVTYYDSAASQNTAPAELLRLRNAYLPKWDAAVRRTIELDPNSMAGLAAQRAMQVGLKKWALAEDFVSKQLTLDQNSPTALESYSNILLGLGRVKEAVAMKQQLHALEPLIGIYASNRAVALWLDGQTDAAIDILKDVGGSVDLARYYAALGRYEEAADILARSTDTRVRDLAPIAVPLLRSAPAKAAAPETLPRLGRLGFIYLYVGAPERMLDYYEQADNVPADDIAYLWHASYAALRKTERFKAIMRKAGFVDYWRERGWPPFCHPTTGDDFACE